MLAELFDKYRCDKGHKHGYEKVYDPIFAKLKDEPITLLEIGILRGQSLSAWADYFPQALIIGIDTFDRVPPEEVDILFHPRVHWFRCDSTRDVPEELTERLDIIIDDGYHTNEAQLETFKRYFPLLKDDGAYFIEDVPPNGTKAYARLLDAIRPYNVTAHNLNIRTGSCILEIRH